MIFGYPIFRHIKFIPFFAVPKLTDTQIEHDWAPTLKQLQASSRVDLENGMEIPSQKNCTNPLAQGTADGAQLKKILSNRSLHTIFCSSLDVAAPCFAPTSQRWFELKS